MLREKALTGFTDYKSVKAEHVLPHEVLLKQEFRYAPGPGHYDSDLWNQTQNVESHNVHVREGKAAMARLIETSSHTARWLNDNLPRNKRSKTLEIALFRVESQIVDRRVRWPLGDELRRMADLEAMGIEPGRMQELLDLLRNELPLLDDLRRQVITSNLR